MFARARTLFDAADYATALPLFRAAANATHSPNAALYTGRCLAQLGRLPDAYHAMRQALTWATQAAVSNPRYAVTRDAAAAELALVENKVGRIALVLTDPPAGAHITAGGRNIPQHMWSDSIAVEPGAVVVVLRAPKKPEQRVEIAVAAGQLRTVTLQPRSAGPVAAPPPAVDAAGLSVVQGVGLGGVVLGGMALVTSAVTFGLAEAALSDLIAECGAGPCARPSAQKDVDDGNALDSATVATFIGGSALTVGGVVMLLAGGEDDAPATQVGVMPWFGTRAVGVTIGGRF